jgi:putative hydroxymethylpyrimidine transport system permease protein
MRGAIYTAAALGAVIIVWQAIVSLSGLPGYILPAPMRVLDTLWNSRALIGKHALVTLLEVVIGLAIGAGLGVVTAIHLAMSYSARLFLRPILVFSQALPVFALAPILTLWLGYGLGSKIAMAVLIIFFPVTSAFFDGLMNTPRGYLDLAQTMGASTRHIMLKIRIPAALPSLASGMKLATVYAPIGATIGEWVGSSQGLGYLMLLANGRVKTDLMFAAMLTLGVMSVTLYALITLALDRMIDFERPSWG